MTPLPTPDLPGSGYVTTGVAAKWLGVTTITVVRWCNLKLIRAAKIPVEDENGKPRYTYLIHKESLIALVKNNEAGPGTEGKDKARTTGK